MAYLNPEDAVLTIQKAAILANMHPQTLRQYDRLGLVCPKRTQGSSRRYSLNDIVALREIARLSADGINLEGIRRILSLEKEVYKLKKEIAKLQKIIEFGSPKKFMAGEVITINAEITPKNDIVIYSKNIIF